MTTITAGTTYTHNDDNLASRFRSGPRKGQIKARRTVVLTRKPTLSAPGIIQDTETGTLKRITTTALLANYTPQEG